ncbi:MAG: TRAP transporter fused permease subunit [Burkholderiaceae bacterium]
MTSSNETPGGSGAVSDERLRAAERFVEEEEGAVSRFGGALETLITALLVIMSLFHLYAAVSIVPTMTLRPVHVGFMLLLVFLIYPATPRLRNRLMWYDVVLALVGVATIVHILMGGDDFWDRSTMPDRADLVYGIVFVLLVLEAARRSTGWIMPAVVLLFAAYAFLGPWLPGHWAHRGYDVESMIGVMYMSLEGIFGTAIDVSATLIIMFTIFGAFLQHSGAGKFFLDFSFALMGGRRSGAGRTVVLSSFLLGGPSGSGVATTVTIGTVAWPMLERAGYDRNSAGGLLAAGGLGAIISPPVLGAAAFLIAEFLKISYLDVLKMAVIPTCLYYLSLFLMVEIDARKFHSAAAEVRLTATAGQLARRFWFHFLSLVAIIGFMVYGFSPLMSVFWATVTAFVVSFFARETAMWPKKLIAALADGSRQALNVAATCAAAGIIVGVVGKTGLGLKFSSIVIAYAGGNLLLTAIYTSLIVWIIGLAVPVTASYIICAVIAAPALTKLGVPDYAAHMFIFYYAVLSEVSPPTALSPFAAAAITDGDPYRTTLQSWKYTLPAFLLPFVFVLEPAGAGLLLMAPKDVAWWQVTWIVLTATAGIAALAGGAQNWVLVRCRLWERLAMIAAGLLLVYPHPMADGIGLALLAAALVSQWVRSRGAKGAAGPGAVSRA